MARRIRDTIEISECTSLGDLIRYLETIRDNLPEDHQAEMRIRGDEDDQRRLTITFFREQSEGELEGERRRPPGSAHDPVDSKLEDLARRLNDIPFVRDKPSTRQS